MALRRRHRDRSAKGLTGVPAAPDRRRPDGRQRRVAAALADGSIGADARPIVDLATGAVVGLDVVFALRISLDGDGAELLDARSLLADSDDVAAVALNSLLLEGVGAAAGGADGAGDCSGLADGLVSVTVDDRFVASREFLTTVKDSVRQAGLGPSQLVLSIDAKPGFEPLWSNVQRLRSHGVQVALDGFALGEAPTEILRRYPFDLVRFAPPTAIDDDELLVCAVRLANNMGCATIADRVTTSDQAAALRRAGTDLAVGPFFESMRSEA